jgi:hypothetical protein
MRLNPAVVARIRAWLPYVAALAPKPVKGCKGIAFFASQTSARLRIPVSPTEFRAALLECPGGIVAEDGCTNLLAGETLRKAELLESRGVAQVSLVARDASPGRENLSRRIVRREDATPENLLTLALRPWAPACYRRRWVTQANFEFANVVAFDVDEGMTWSAVIQRLQGSALAFSAYTTRSHGVLKASRSGATRPACDRFRVILWLERACCSPASYRATLQAQAAELGLPVDPSAMDAARYFYGRPTEGLTAWAEGTQIQPSTPPSRVPTSTPLVAEDQACWPPLHERLRRAKAYFRRVPPAIAGKGGNLATVIAIRRCWDFGITNEDDAALALEEWNARCVPPWEGREWRDKIRSALKGEGPPGAKLSEQPRGITVEPAGEDET